ncbi:hypothetical protein GSI_13653 [Ganoderma sinense ZZ0214-1]|uniref:Ribosomal protein S21 n=1 Tax=Ganoderma sinense ZZ0214-1 TaxID=1077348 RepID=A0A2G8RQX0_9APHY|nr:hypothetical protein GSI_13653 [Ganoderma sinense ZZ0214-1]
MLPNVPAFAPSLLRQYARRAASSIRPSNQLRALATTSVLHQSSDDPSTSHPYLPTWIDSHNYLQSSNDGHWKHIMGPLRSQPKVEKFVPPEQFWKSQEQSSVIHLRAPHDAYSGRSVPVFKGDIATALRQLKSILTINNVRSQNVRDERHEKKGEKRNRLKSLRWRRRFAHEVRKRVQLVNEIRARGA